jgi:regulator of sigma D
MKGVTMFFFGGKNSDKDKNEDKLFEGVQYHDDLLEKLTSDHKKLFKHYNKLLDAAKKRNQRKVQENLKNFRIDFKIHHQSEKKQLYTYLKNHFKLSDKEVLINKLNSSADNIYDNIIYFLSTYTDKKLDTEDFEKLQKELEEIGKVLIQRVEQEEGELYTLYKSI